MATSGVGVRELPEAHTFDFIGSEHGKHEDEEVVKGKGREKMREEVDEGVKA